MMVNAHWTGQQQSLSHKLPVNYRPLAQVISFAIWVHHLHRHRKSSCSSISQWAVGLVCVSQELFSHSRNSIGPLGRRKPPFVQTNKTKVIQTLIIRQIRDDICTIAPVHKAPISFSWVFICEFDKCWFGSSFTNIETLKIRHLF